MSFPLYRGFANDVVTLDQARRFYPLINLVANFAPTILVLLSPLDSFKRVHSIGLAFICQQWLSKISQGNILGNLVGYWHSSGPCHYVHLSLVHLVFVLTRFLGLTCMLSSRIRPIMSLWKRATQILAKREWVSSNHYALSLLADMFSKLVYILILIYLPEPSRISDNYLPPGNLSHFWYLFTSRKPIAGVIMISYATAMSLMEIYFLNTTQVYSLFLDSLLTHSFLIHC